MFWLGVIWYRMNQTPPQHFLCSLLILTTCDSFRIRVILCKKKKNQHQIWASASVQGDVVLSCLDFMTGGLEFGSMVLLGTVRRWHESEDRFIQSSRRRCPRCWYRPPAGPLLWVFKWQVEWEGRTNNTMTAQHSLYFCLPYFSVISTSWTKIFSDFLSCFADNSWQHMNTQSACTLTIVQHVDTHSSSLKAARWHMKPKHVRLPGSSTVWRHRSFSFGRVDRRRVQLEWG